MRRRRLRAASRQLLLALRPTPPSPAHARSFLTLPRAAFNLVLGLDLLYNSGEWAGKTGVLGPEAFPAPPFMAKMASYGFPYGIEWRVGEPSEPAEMAAAAAAGKA